MFPSDVLSSAEAAIFETFVVPRYYRMFSDLVLEMILPTPGARIAHVGCRTGFPDSDLCERIPESTLYGVDASLSAIELARHKVAAHGMTQIEYCLCEALPVPYPSEVFSHVFCLHPTVNQNERGILFSELGRLLYERGQVLVALPLRGSFQEISDLLREYALKHDDDGFGRLVEEQAIERPSLEQLAEELESVGLDDVDVEVRNTVLTFESGRAIMEDPVCRLLVVPEIRAAMNRIDLTRPLSYLREAIDRYWSEGTFELTVSVGCASARRSQ